MTHLAFVRAELLSATMINITEWAIYKKSFLVVITAISTTSVYFTRCE